MGSVAVARGFSWSAACEIFIPGPGFGLVSLHCTVGSQIPGPPGEPRTQVLLVYTTAALLSRESTGSPRPLNKWTHDASGSMASVFHHYSDLQATEASSRALPLSAASSFSSGPPHAPWVWGCGLGRTCALLPVPPSPPTTACLWSLSLGRWSWLRPGSCPVPCSVTCAQMTVPSTALLLWPVTRSGDCRRLCAKEEPRCPVAGEIMGCTHTGEHAVVGVHDRRLSVHRCVSV